MSARAETAKVRKIIKKRCPTVSVRMETGTARGWVRINGSKDKFGKFTPTEKRCLKSFGIETGLGGGTDMMPGEKAYFIKHKKMPKDRSKYKYW